MDRNSIMSSASTAAFIAAANAEIARLGTKANVVRSALPLLDELSHWVALFGAEEQRLGNIRAGWELPQQIGEARA